MCVCDTMARPVMVEMRIEVSLLIGISLMSAIMVLVALLAAMFATYRREQEQEHMQRVPDLRLTALPRTSQRRGLPPS